MERKKPRSAATTSTPFGGRVDTQSSSPYLNGGGYGMMGGYGMGGYGRMGGYGMGGYGGYGMGYGGYGRGYGGYGSRYGSYGSYY